MSATRRAWIVAASIATVEALKDQGICRWNYVLRSVQQHAKNNINNIKSASSSSTSTSQAKRVSTSQSSAAFSNKLRDERMMKKVSQSEESLRTVMYLSCWGPNN